MESYAEGLDSKARYLKAKGLPHTKSHVLLPFPDMNPNEVYAPNYNDGDRVVLIRYPHGGRFEIPELIVNNKGPARKTLGDALDAIGIHPSMAEKLSGADFDGDTVTVIPNNQGKIKAARSLKELKNFDPIAKYRVDEDHPAMIWKKDKKTGVLKNTGDTIASQTQQTQMGIVSNLITDMTIKGAKDSEIARAVRHSMVVIDAKKHKLDYKQSAIDNGIQALQKKYQSHINPVTGKDSVSASTIVSQSKKKVKITDKGVDPNKFINPKNPSGKPLKTVSILDYVDDVSSLSSGTAVEGIYVDYIKKVKSLKNTVTKEIVSTPNPKRKPEATKQYKNEVDSLDAKLKNSLLNAPMERQAQLLATQTYHKTLKEENYNLDKDQKKKLKSQAVADARDTVGVTKRQDRVIDITPNEWEAIQSGAISPTKLRDILKHADMEQVTKYATPRTPVKLSTAKLTRATTMLNSGKYTYAEVAQALGTSVATLRSELRNDGDIRDNEDD